MKNAQPNANVHHVSQISVCIARPMIHKMPSPTASAMGAAVLVARPAAALAPAATPNPQSAPRPSNHVNQGVAWLVSPASQRISKPYGQ
jgi:hypothetical protein